jgi:hypothetical protein
MKPLCLVPALYFFLPYFVLYTLILSSRKTPVYPLLFHRPIPIHFSKSNSDFTSDASPTPLRSFNWTLSMLLKQFLHLLLWHLRQNTCPKCFGSCLQYLLVSRAGILLSFFQVHSPHSSPAWIIVGTPYMLNQNLNQLWGRPLTQ